MFTGIIETKGIVAEIISSGSNRTFWIRSSISSELKADQSVSHDGVCLTVEAIEGDLHRVTAVNETLKKTNLRAWKEHGSVNLERCMVLSDRLDGHLVQGHIDTTGNIRKIKPLNGSWNITIDYPKKFAPLLVEKGSICLNGISLTVFNLKKNSFTVTIIPFTYELTNINELDAGTKVNLEFDIIGKYLLRSLNLKNI